MSYKLICLDVDGTLLNDEKRVPDPVKESLKKAQKLRQEGKKAVLRPKT